MEQKKTLWILSAAGIFLCAVIGTAVFMYSKTSPKNRTAISMKDSGEILITPFSGKSDYSSAFTDYGDSDYEDLSYDEPETTGENTTNSGFIDLNNISDNSSDNLALPPESTTDAANAVTENNGTANSGITLPAENVTVIANGSTNVLQLGGESTTIDLNMLKNGSYSNSNVQATNKAAEEAMEKASASAKPAETVTNVSPRTTVTPAEKKVEPAPGSSPKTAAAKTTDSSAKANTTKTSAPTSTKATQKEPDRFWIQAGSYSSKKLADEARAVLDQNKIACEVFTHTDPRTNKLYYRVRVGPYSTKDEATYWQKQINKIEPFAKDKTFIVNSSAPAKN